MLAGAAYGAQAIPEEWLKVLDRAVQDEVGAQVTDLLSL
jgi:ADP-ribosylglycohydrolase